MYSLYIPANSNAVLRVNSLASFVRGFIFSYQFQIALKEMKNRILAHVVIDKHILFNS